MKGVVFTEFLEMVESKFSTEIADQMITGAQVANGGAYTAVGTYPADELGKLVVALSKETGATVPELMNAYGRHLFGRFHEGYPQLFAGSPDSFSFLRTIDQVVHVEVRKLYPDAELPHFETIEAGPGRLTMIYRSPRCLGDFAEGLMEGCFAHFGERIRVTRSDAAGGREVRFDLERL
ncbi:MAG: hypothetical protein RJA55_2805 [Acidobacteriota bacterium]|jgi:hypothetical protein